MRSLKQALIVLLFFGLGLMGQLGCRGSSNNPPPPVAPTISTQPVNQTVLEGATATFTVTATGTDPLSYQWNKRGTAVTGATSASYTTPATVLADNAASFTVTVTNIAGSVTSTAATLTVNPAPPTITTQPANRTVIAPATATFTVVATGSATLTYQWKKGATAITGATSTTYTTPATTLADNAASFTVVVTNTVGTVTSSAAILTVQAAPVFTTQPAGGTVTAGTAVTFTSAATGNPAPTYQWYKGATTLLTGQTAATLTIATPTLADAGSYTVTATNIVNSVTSNAAVLVVNQAPVFTTQPASATVIAPASITFTAAASGFPIPTYQWQKGGVAITGATSATYTIASTSPADAATYTCVATNSIGTATSAAAVLSVTVPPAITTQPASQTVLAPATATFTVVATGTPTPSYQWYKDGSPITGATSASYTTPATSLAYNLASYMVVVSNGVGTPASSSAAILTVQAPPVITVQPANQSVGVNQTATFSVTATGNPTPTYQWQKGGVPIPTGAIGSTYTTPATVLGDTGSSFDVVVNGDFDNEGNEDFFVTISAVAGASTPGSDLSATGVISNDDFRFINIGDVTLTEGDTGTKLFSFPVTLTQPAPAGGRSSEMTASVLSLAPRLASTSARAAALSGVATTPLPIGVRKAGLRTKTAESAGMRVPGWV